MSSSNSNPAQALSYILNSMPPAVFVSRLRAALDPAMGYSSGDIDSFLDGLANLGFERAVKQAEKVVDQGAKGKDEGKDELHCVRCHKVFRETENAYDACKIQHTHTYTSATARTSGHAHDRCLSCDKIPPPSAIVEEKCIVARHTTNVKDLQERSALLRTCAEAGCAGRGPQKVERLLEGRSELLKVEEKVLKPKEEDAKENRPAVVLPSKSPFTFGNGPAPESPVATSKATPPVPATSSAFGSISALPVATLPAHSPARIVKPLRNTIAV